MNTSTNMPNNTSTNNTSTNAKFPTLHITEVANPTQLHEFCALAPALTRTQYDQGQPDRHLIAYVDGHAVARCSLWWRSAPVLPGERVGCIGHYAATDRAAAELLARACAALTVSGCTLAVGPLDGSTFRAYRLVTGRAMNEGTDGDGGKDEREVHPPFLLEPNNPDAWVDDFQQAGFHAWSEYVSALAPLTGPDPQLARRTAELAAHGVQLRTLDASVLGDGPDDSRAFDRELARIYPLVMTAFANNPLFTAISPAEFHAQYAPVRALLAPELVVLAERAGELVGLLFALPDFAQAQRGETVDTVILKTLAVLPSVAGIGLGSLLSARVHTQAYELGYRWAIHALMHVKNRSRRISAHNARPFRHYTLFARTLKP